MIRKYKSKELIVITKTSQDNVINKEKCTPIGRGTVTFQTKDGNKIRATNVLHVPGLGMNLLSVSQHQNKGYDVYFIRDKVYVKHSNQSKKEGRICHGPKLHHLEGFTQSSRARINAERTRHEGAGI